MRAGGRIVARTGGEDPAHASVCRSSEWAKEELLVPGS